MSEQTTFKVGDRVRFLKDYDNEYVYADKGDCGTIVTVDRDFYTVNLDSPEQIYVHSSDIERVEPIDPKTAFLSELKELLEKYNAEIEYHMGGDDKSDYSEYYAITIGGDRLTYDSCEGTSITADNIMDYDKE